MSSFVFAKNKLQRRANTFWIHSTRSKQNLVFFFRKLKDVGVENLFQSNFCIEFRRNVSSRAFHQSTENIKCENIKCKSIQSNVGI